ncbi:MAG: hypothetical protein FWG59_00790, partial [Betaproteobacteria bacterium]|nr:hypothetical protein [Betaproteobacteria bacterium]
RNRDQHMHMVGLQIFEASLFFRIRQTLGVPPQSRGFTQGKLWGALLLYRQFFLPVSGELD